MHISGTRVHVANVLQPEVSPKIRIAKPLYKTKTSGGFLGFQGNALAEFGSEMGKIKMTHTYVSFYKNARAKSVQTAQVVVFLLQITFLGGPRKFILTQEKIADPRFRDFRVAGSPQGAIISYMF